MFILGFTQCKLENSQEDLKFVNAEDNGVSESGSFSVAIGGFTKGFKLNEETWGIK